MKILGGNMKKCLLLIGFCIFLCGCPNKKADFTNADLTRKNLGNSIYTNTKFNNANLTYSTLSGSQLSKSDFSSADLSYSVMNDVKMNLVLQRVGHDCVTEQQEKIY